MTESRVALVTGGSRGIGRAIALALARDGCWVVVNYVSHEDAALRVVEEIRSAGGQAEMARFDVARAEEVDAALRGLIERHGRLDVVVNNAGIALDGLLLRLKDDDWSEVLGVNLTGAMHVARAAARHLLKARQGGRLINITSVVGEAGNAGQVSYAAAKAGLIGLTRTLARELAPRGVTVNAVSPGFVETEMTVALLEPARREALVRQIPLGRVGRPEDVAEAVRFLASSDAGYITGQVLRINGGLLM